MFVSARGVLKGRYHLYHFLRLFMCCVHICMSNHISDLINAIFVDQGKISRSRKIYKLTVNEKLFSEQQTICEHQTVTWLAHRL